MNNKIKEDLSIKLYKASSFAFTPFEDFKEGGYRLPK
jgi:hypothetical protein